MADSNKTSNPIYLVVDDEIIKERQKKEFVKQFRLPYESGIFAETHEEAISAIQSNSNIVLSFIDLRIPLNKTEIYEPDDGTIRPWKESMEKQINLSEENGIKLLEDIKKKPPENLERIYVYSAYEEKVVLEQISKNYQDIVKSCFQKRSYTPKNILEEIIDYGQIFSLQKLPRATGFDYSSLDLEVSSFIQGRATEIKRLKKRVSEDMVNIGKYLKEVKQRLPYGTFGKWLELEFSWSESTARRFMRISQNFGTFNLNDLENIMPSALYQMASPSAPRKAIKEIIERAKAGEKIADKTAQEIKNKYKKVKQPKRENLLKKAKYSTEDNSKLDSSRTQAKNKNPKQTILAVYPTEKALKKSWWQLGEKNRLFCGEPKDQEFLDSLPSKISLTLTFLPKNDLSLVPYIESDSSLIFRFKEQDLNIDSIISESCINFTLTDQIVVFNYVYYFELLELAVNRECSFWAAEPDLGKCEQILSFWQEKSSVKRIKD